ncbi:hypothetical protein RAS1_04120 [Phycisphaerae bacterium RAS1]|nr:hypothetical protein RAS1_04120 [Phycisphaerae bacterium RAS1]
MSTMTKVFIVLTAVLSITVSCLFVAAAAQWSNWKKLAEDYQVMADAAITQRMNTEAVMSATLAMKDATLGEMARQKADLELKNKEQADAEADARAKLARAQNEAVAAEAGRKKLEEIMDIQTAQLSALQKQNQSLLGENIDLQTRNQRQNTRILELTSESTIRLDEIRNLQEKLHAAEQQLATGGKPAAARPADTPAGVSVGAAGVAGPIPGEIMEVAGNYASVNVGESSGLSKGMVAMVFRGRQYLADFEVDSVRPKEAGGRIKLAQGDVRPGDRVVFNADKQ